VRDKLADEIAKKMRCGESYRSMVICPKKACGYTYFENRNTISLFPVNYSDSIMDEKFTGYFAKEVLDELEIRYPNFDKHRDLIVLGKYVKYYFTKIYVPLKLVLQ